MLQKLSNVAERISETPLNFIDTFRAMKLPKRYWHYKVAVGVFSTTALATSVISGYLVNGILEYIAGDTLTELVEKGGWQNYAILGVIAAADAVEVCAVGGIMLLPAYFVAGRALIREENRQRENEIGQRDVSISLEEIIIAQSNRDGINYVNLPQIAHYTQEVILSHRKMVDQIKHFSQYAETDVRYFAPPTTGRAPGNASEIILACIHSKKPNHRIQPNEPALAAPFMEQEIDTTSLRAQRQIRYVGRQIDTRNAPVLEGIRELASMQYEAITVLKSLAFRIERLTPDNQPVTTYHQLSNEMIDKILGMVDEFKRLRTDRYIGFNKIDTILSKRNALPNLDNGQEGSSQSVGLHTTRALQEINEEKEKGKGKGRENR